ncbi:hypothetical protein [Roseibium album]|uniref:hypothetical protein n=1 Tax=Roseibium album TaxID=311410 RepID=UPI003298D180
MLTDENQVLFLKVLDEIIPAGGVRRMPSAGVKAVAESVLSATAYSTDAPGTVERLLEAVSARSPGFSELSSDDRVTVLKAVEMAEPRDFAELVRLTYMAYYSRPEIRPLLGVGAHPVHPHGYVVEHESDTLMDELTAPVRARGAAYRQA